MRRSALTFERVVAQYELMKENTAVTVPELAGHVKLVLYSFGVGSDVKIAWLMDVIRDCDNDHEEVASVAVSVFAQLVETSLRFGHTREEVMEANALRAAQFLATNAACAQIDSRYKKHAVNFLLSWWNEILDEQTTRRTSEDSVSYYLRHREWVKALASAFVNLRCWEHLQNAGALCNVPRLYAMLREDSTYELHDYSIALPNKLTWQHWDALPTLVMEWKARVVPEEGKAELEAIANMDPEDLKADEAAIHSVCGQLLTYCSALWGQCGTEKLRRGIVAVSTLLNLLTIFQHLRRKLLK